MTDLRDQLRGYGQQHRAEQQPVTPDEIRWADMALRTEGGDVTELNRGGPRLWLAGVAAALVVILVGAIAWFSRSSPGVDSAGVEQLSTPIDVAEAFIEARNAHDLETTRSLLAQDAVINDKVRSVEAYAVEFEIEEIMDWRLSVEECLVRDQGPPVEVRCDYTHDTAWSRALGHESLPGGTFTLEIQDGRVLKVTHFFNSESLTGIAWRPFVYWVRDFHPDDFGNLFTDTTGQALQRTPEALALLEQLTEEFVAAAEADQLGGNANPAVVFDGSSCLYTGPLEFVGPTVIRVAYTNTSDALANLGIWSVPEGTGPEDIERDETYQDLPGNLQNVRWQVSAGEEITLVVALAPGPHMFNCFVHARDATESAPALHNPVFFRVVEG